ncbi:MAG: cobalamin-binding protein [Thermodesulfobacteriota bacterium]
MRRILPFFLVAILVAVPARGRTVVDQLGRSLTVPDDPQRVVALAPSLTEIVYSLGQEAKLKGVTRYSDYPAAAKKLPRVGSYIRLDLERIVALKPDLCLAIRQGNPGDQIARLEALGIPVYVVDPRDLRGVMASLRGIGAALNAEPQARLLAERMEQEIAAITRKTGQAAHRPRVFFQVDSSAIVTSGTNTFTHELITLAGGINLGAGPVDYPRLGWEQVLALRPEVVVITSMAGRLTPEELQAEWRRWPVIPAVRQNRLHVVDTDLFNRPTARLVEGLRILAAIIHPELFGGR